MSPRAPRSAASRAPRPSVARRVTEVLDEFAESGDDLGVTEIARRLRYSKSVVHRILVALVEAGYVAIDPATRRYRLGAKVLLLARAASAHDDLRRRALPHLQSIRERTGETATLSLLRGAVRVYAEQIESRNAVRQTVEVGSEAPLHLGASGKAILAFLPEAARPPRVRAAGLDADLERVRRRGYAVSRAERIAGAASVAAPIFDHRGAVVGSVSAAGVLARSDARTTARYGAVVAAEARALSRALGWRASPTARRLDSPRRGA
jgi:DNA-binding IclR family transcriptional regulator